MFLTNRVEEDRPCSKIACRYSITKISSRWEGHAIIHVSLILKINLIWNKLKQFNNSFLKKKQDFFHVSQSLNRDQIHAHTIYKPLNLFSLWRHHADSHWTRADNEYFYSFAVKEELSGLIRCTGTYILPIIHKARRLSPQHKDTVGSFTQPSPHH